MIFFLFQEPARDCPITPSPGAVVDEMGTTKLDIRVQTRAVIENIRDILRSQGTDLSAVVEMSCFLVSMNDFGGFNEVWSEYFDENGPTRTTVAVHQLPHPLLLIEMKGVAYAPIAGSQSWTRALREDVIRRYLKAMEAGDLKATVACFAAQGIVVSPVYGEVAVGEVLRAAIRGYGACCREHSRHLRRSR